MKTVFRPMIFLAIGKYSPLWKKKKMWHNCHGEMRQLDLLFLFQVFFTQVMSSVKTNKEEDSARQINAGKMRYDILLFALKYVEGVNF